LLADPVDALEHLTAVPHPRIPLPRDISLIGVPTDVGGATGTPAGTRGGPAQPS